MAELNKNGLLVVGQSFPGVVIFTFPSSVIQEGAGEGRVEMEGGH